MRENFRAGIESIQDLIAADPEGSRAILKEGENKRARETVRIARFMHEQLELIAVVAIQPVLGSEPHEAPIILYDLGNSRLRKTVGSGDVSKPETARNDDRQTDDVRCDSRFGRAMTRRFARGRGGASLDARCRLSQPE